VELAILGTLKLTGSASAVAAAASSILTAIKPENLELVYKLGLKLNVTAVVVSVILLDSIQGIPDKLTLLSILLHIL